MVFLAPGHRLIQGIDLKGSPELCQGVIPDASGEAGALAELIIVIDHSHIVLGELDIDLDMADAAAQDLLVVFDGVLPDFRKMTPVSADHQLPAVICLELFQKCHAWSPLFRSAD